MSSIAKRKTKLDIYDASKPRETKQIFDTNQAGLHVLDDYNMLDVDITKIEQEINNKKIEKIVKSVGVQTAIKDNKKGRKTGYFRILFGDLQEGILKVVSAVIIIAIILVIAAQVIDVDNTELTNQYVETIKTLLKAIVESILSIFKS